MEYPIFELPLVGGSLLIASMAIFHVFIAQFSIGASTLLVLAERRANREGDADTLAFLKRFSLAVLLIPYVLGTLTGVGIWFVTAIVNPRALSAMIHLFVWGWASEWTLFVVDIAAIYLYFYTWGKIRPAAHNAIGIVFAVSSMLTLVIINAIISFMLTSGAWKPGLADGGFWQAFFNPSFWPTTLMRLFVTFALAGAGCLLLMAIKKDLPQTVREKMSRLAYRMMLPSLLCLPLTAWAFHVIPQRSREFIQGSGVPMGMFAAMGLTCFAILAVAGLASMFRREAVPTLLGSLLMVLFAFIAYGSFEFVREGVRKPYVIEGFMYSTGVTTPEAAGLDRVANLKQLQRDGVLSGSPWALPVGKTAGELTPFQRGQAVFRASCAACHQPEAGYNALRPLIAQWEPHTIREYLDSMHRQRPMMPPFPGTESEKDDLTDYLRSLTVWAGGGHP